MHLHDFTGIWRATERAACGFGSEVILHYAIGVELKIAMQLGAIMPKSEPESHVLNLESGISNATPWFLGLDFATRLGMPVRLRGWEPLERLNS